MMTFEEFYTKMEKDCFNDFTMLGAQTAYNILTKSFEKELSKVRDSADIENAKWRDWKIKILEENKQLKAELEQSLFDKKVREKVIEELSFILRTDTPLHDILSCSQCDHCREGVIWTQNSIQEILEILEGKSQ